MGGFGFEGGLGDIFEAFFGQVAGTGGRGGAARRRGPTPRCASSSAFDEAVFGSRKEISVRLPATCATCAGRGHRAGHRAR